MKLGLVGDNSISLDTYHCFKDKIRELKLDIDELLIGDNSCISKFGKLYAKEFNIPVTEFNLSINEQKNGAEFTRRFEIIEACDFLVLFSKNKDLNKLVKTLSEKLQKEYLVIEC